MEKPAKVSKRPPNPPCGKCKHPRSFHPRDTVKHRRPCNAYGCHCSDFKKSDSTS